MSDGTVLATFSVAGPGSMTFDGTNIWVAGSGTLFKLRASDGAILCIMRCYRRLSCAQRLTTREKRRSCSLGRGGVGGLDVHLAEHIANGRPGS